VSEFDPQDLCSALRLCYVFDDTLNIKAELPPDESCVNSTFLLHYTLQIMQKTITTTFIAWW